MAPQPSAPPFITNAVKKLRELDDRAAKRFEERCRIQLHDE
jgi:hypothetical protein